MFKIKKCEVLFSFFQEMLIRFFFLGVICISSEEKKIPLYLGVKRIVVISHQKKHGHTQIELLINWLRPPAEGIIIPDFSGSYEELLDEVARFLSILSWSINSNHSKGIQVRIL